MNLNLGVLRRKTMALGRVWNQPPLLCAREAEKALLAEGGRGCQRKGQQAGLPSQLWAGTRSRAPLLTPSPPPATPALQCSALALLLRALPSLGFAFFTFSAHFTWTF